MNNKYINITLKNIFLNQYIHTQIVYIYIYLYITNMYKHYIHIIFNNIIIHTYSIHSFIPHNSKKDIAFRLNVAPL